MSMMSYVPDPAPFRPRFARPPLVLAVEPPLTPLALRRRLNPAIAAEIRSAAETDQLDAVVAPYGERRPGWRSAPLWSEPLALYVARKHPLAASTSIEAADLARTTLTTCGGWTGVLLAGLGVSPAHIHYSRDWRDVAALVSEGFGVVIAGRSAADAFGADVHIRPIDGWLTYCAYWPDGGDTPALRRLLEHPHG